MADLALIREAAKRGILPPEKQSLFDEAVRRGLIEPVTVQSAPIPQEPPIPQADAIGNQVLLGSMMNEPFQTEVVPEDVANASGVRGFAPGILGATGSLAGSAFGPLGGFVGALGGGAAGGAVEAGTEGDIAGRAVRRAAEAGTGELAGLGIGKGLQLGGRLLFGGGGDDAARAAAQFARENEVPLSLESVGGGAGAAASRVAKATLPGEFFAKQAAKRVASFVDDQVARFGGGLGSEAIEGSAVKAQTFLKGALSETKDLADNAFEAFRATVGRETPVNLQNARKFVADHFDELKAVLPGKKFKQLLAAVDEKGTSFSFADDVRIAIKPGKGKVGKRLLDDMKSAIVSDFDDVAKSLGAADMPSELVRTANKAQSELMALRNIPGIGRLSEDVRSGTGYLKSLFSPGNEKVLKVLQEKAPDVYAEAAQANLARVFSDSFREGGETAGRFLDGGKLRSWYEGSKKLIEEAYGPEIAKALDNFTNFAKAAQGDLRFAAQVTDPVRMGQRLVAEGAAIGFAPAVAIPAEATSIALAKMFTNPGSALFRMFEKGVSPNFGAAFVPGLQAIGAGTGPSIADVFSQ